MRYPTSLTCLGLLLGSTLLVGCPGDNDTSDSSPPSGGDGDTVDATLEPADGSSDG